jgi:hypothetical protein
MAPHATVLVALRRQNSFSHHSFDGDDVFGRCTDTADTSAALRLDFCVLARDGWSGGAALFAAFGT